MDITNPKLLYLKGALFVVTAGMACALLRLEQPTLRTALLAIAIWASARASAGSRRYGRKVRGVNTSTPGTR